jgi:hypothetical protein
MFGRSVRRSALVVALSALFALTGSAPLAVAQPLLPPVPGAPWCC